MCISVGYEWVSVSTQAHERALMQARVFLCDEGMSVCVSKWVFVRICKCAKVSVRVTV